MSKIDLIIDALYKTKLLMDAHGQYPHTLREVSEALAAAHELKALKPVGYMDSRGVLFNKTTHPQLNTPLYALDEVTK
jgi:hypothetical protein